MKIAVTGGSGFIGRWLLRVLAEQGHSVRNVDRVPQPDGFGGVLADLVVPAEARRAVAGVDAVFHLAGLVDVSSGKAPLSSFDVHVAGTLNVVRGCIEEGVGWLGLASTFLVYRAATGDGPYDEQTPLGLDGLEPFEASKIAAELTVRQCERFADGRLAHAIFRFGSTYGPGGGSNVLGGFVAAARSGEPIEVWGRGDRPNQFTYVEDIAGGCAAALGRTGVFNLVSPEVVTTAQAAEHFRERYGAEVVYHRDRPERRALGFVSAEAARRELGWRPRPLADGLAELMREPARSR